MALSIPSLPGHLSGIWQPSLPRVGPKVFAITGQTKAILSCKFPDRLQYKTCKTVLMDPSGREHLECQTRVAERSPTALLPTNMATSIYRENLLASLIRNIEFWPCSWAITWYLLFSCQAFSRDFAVNLFRWRVREELAECRADHVTQKQLTAA